VTAIDPGVPTQLGHVALRVRDVERAARFYSEVLGLKVHRVDSQRAFLGIRPDASHELALFAIDPDAPGPDERRVGMYHMAWEMPSFAALNALHDRLLASGAEIAGYSDGQSNVMFRDPDGNENEAIWEPSPAELADLEARGEPVPRLRLAGA
jgi:catechol-2,3-dioxygenase